MAEKRTKIQCVFRQGGDSCHNIQVDRGFCRAHLLQHLDGKRLIPVAQELAHADCRGPECTRPPAVKSVGLCAAHYQQYKRAGAMTPIRPKPAAGAVIVVQVHMTTRKRDLIKARAIGTGKKGISEYLLSLADAEIEDAKRRGDVE